MLHAIHRIRWILSHYEKYLVVGSSVFYPELTTAGRARETLMLR